MKLPDKVSAIVFDCDGLLVDSEPAWSVGEAAIFAEHGFDFGPAQKQLVIGKSISGGCEAMATYFGRPGAGPELVGRLLELVLAELRRGIDPLPGVVALLDALAGRIPLGVASNSNRELLDVSLAGSGLADRFDVTISANDVENHKPHPQLFLEAFRRLNADPVRGVALEDSPTGIASARASGAFVLVVPSSPHHDHDGDLIVPSLNDSAVLDWGRSVQPI